MITTADVEIVTTFWGNQSFIFPKLSMLIDMHLLSRVNVKQVAVKS